MPLETSQVPAPSWPRVLWRDGARGRTAGHLCRSPTPTRAPAQRSREASSEEKGKVSVCLSSSSPRPARGLEVGLSRVGHAEARADTGTPKATGHAPCLLQRMKLPEAQGKGCSPLGCGRGKDSVEASCLPARLLCLCPSAGLPGGSVGLMKLVDFLHVPRYSCP